MKIVPLILALIALRLAFGPCTDFNSPNLSDVEITNNHNHPEEENDTCSPFCICQCCGASIELTELNNWETTLSDHHFKYDFPYNFHYKFDRTNSIWHPPLLA